MKKIVILLILGLVILSSCETQSTVDPASDFTSWYQISTGKPQDLIFASYKTTMIANGEDETLLRISVEARPNHGIVWPDGHISNLDNLAELLKAGTAACREVDPNIAVMMHLALGGQNAECVFWLDNMIARGVEFDIVGLSYYPRWHCTLDDLDYNMRNLIERYQKDVNVVEYSAFKREVHELVFSLPCNRGNGTAIWEPLNTWSRFIDREGNATEEIKIYDGFSAKYLK